MRQFNGIRLFWALIRRASRGPPCVPTPSNRDRARCIKVTTTLERKLLERPGPAYGVIEGRILYDPDTAFVGLASHAEGLLAR